MCAVSEEDPIFVISLMVYIPINCTDLGKDLNITKFMIAIL